MPRARWRCRLLRKGRSKNLLRVALAFCDARYTPVQLRFSTTIVAARDGFSRSFQVNLELRPCASGRTLSLAVRELYELSGSSYRGLVRQSDISELLDLKIVALRLKQQGPGFHRCPRRCDRITPSRSNPSACPVVPNPMKSTPYKRRTSP
jgi:hypothetical protein